MLSLQTPHCPPDAELLEEAMEVFRCFLTWPEPYSSVCRDLLSTLSLELKAPGEHSAHHEKAICVLNCCISTLICPLVTSYRGAHDAPKCDYSHASWSPSIVPQAAIFSDTHVFNRVNVKLLYVPRFFLFFKKNIAVKLTMYFRLLLPSQGFPFRGSWEKNRVSSPPARAPKPCKYALFFSSLPRLVLMWFLFFARLQASHKPFLTLSALPIWTLTYFLCARWGACCRSPRWKVPIHWVCMFTCLQNCVADEPQWGACWISLGGQAAHLRSALAKRHLRHPDQARLPVHTGNQIPPAPHPHSAAGRNRK